MYIRCIRVPAQTIAAVGYNRARMTLRVVSNDGSARDYVDVPREVALDLLFAESSDAFYGKAIKNVFASRAVGANELQPEAALTTSG